MKNKGFAISGILYTILLIFLCLLMMILFRLQNRKNILDQLKDDTMNNLIEECTKYDDGHPIYFNPVAGTICDNYNTANSANEVKTGCMKWYVFNDSANSHSVSLILDHNTTSKMAWNQAGVSTNRNEIENQFNDDTLGWKAELNPRLISGVEIARMTGNSSFITSQIGSAWFYFDNNTKTPSSTCTPNGNITNCKYGWLYDRASLNCQINGCLNNATAETTGYWTSTIASGEAVRVWVVRADSHLSSREANYSDYGIRPVISVKKELLSENACE